MDEKVATLIALVVIVCSILFAVFTYNTRMTLSILKESAKTILECNGEGFSAPEDVWGTKIQYTFIWGQYKNVATCTSAGPDLKFGTGDDLSVQREDLNKTRIATKYIGSKTSEALKGFLKGLANQDKH